MFIIDFFNVLLTNNINLAPNFEINRFVLFFQKAKRKQKRFIQTLTLIRLFFHQSTLLSKKNTLEIKTNLNRVYMVIKK